MSRNKLNQDLDFRIMKILRKNTFENIKKYLN